MPNIKLRNIVNVSCSVCTSISGDIIEKILERFLKLHILVRTAGYNGYQRKWVIQESHYWWLLTQLLWSYVCKVHFSCILLLTKIFGKVIAFSSITTNHWIVNFHLHANVKHSNQLLRNWYVFARISAFWR